MSETTAYECPHCREIVEAAPASVAQFVLCPRCDVEFEIPAADIGPPAVDELDGVRIRQLAAARRAMYRIRSYYVIGAAASGVVAIELLWMAYGRIRTTGLTLWVAIDALFACIAVWGTQRLGRTVIAISRELARSTLSTPSTPPELSKLGDGSEQWKRLNDVR